MPSAQDRVQFMPRPPNTSGSQPPRNPESTRNPTPGRGAEAEEKLKIAQQELYWCEQGLMNCEEYFRDAMIEYEMAGERFVSFGGTVRTETAMDAAYDKVREEQDKLLVVRKGVIHARLEVKDTQGDLDAAMGMDRGRNRSENTQFIMG